MERACPLTYASSDSTLQKADDHGCVAFFETETVWIAKPAKALTRAKPSTNKL